MCQGLSVCLSVCLLRLSVCLSVSLFGLSVCFVKCLTIEPVLTPDNTSIIHARNKESSADILNLLSYSMSRYFQIKYEENGVIKIIRECTPHKSSVAG